MNKLFRNKLAFILFLLPALAFFTIVEFIPIIKLIYYSFCDYGLGDPTWIGFKNYEYLFKEDDVFFTAIKNTLFFMTFTTLCNQILGVSIAATLMNMKRGRNFFKNIYYLPAVLSSASLGLMWMFIFGSNMGLNQLLKKIGIKGPYWLMETKGFIILPMFIIGIVSIWQYFGQTMMLYMAQMSNIPRDLYEAASIDGANKFKIFWRITIPLIKPMFVTTLSLNCIGSLKIFDTVFTMTKGGPNNKTSVMATLMYNQGFEFFKYGYASAIAVILLILCLLMTLIVNKGIRVEDYEL